MHQLLLPLLIKELALARCASGVLLLLIVFLQGSGQGVVVKKRKGSDKEKKGKAKKAKVEASAVETPNEVSSACAAVLTSGLQDDDTVEDGPESLEVDSDASTVAVRAVPSNHVLTLHAG